MSANLKDAQQRAAAAALKEQRARDGAQAMRDYMAERQPCIAHRVSAERLGLAAHCAPD